MGVLLTNDNELKTVADAIRAKTGGTSSLSYPTGMANAIAGIASDCNATASDILNGKTAYVGNAKVTGNIPGKAATTYNTSSSDQTITAGQYLSGDQTIKAVTTSNIDAANIKYNVNVKVGDANNATRIKNVTGTFTEDGNIAAGDVLSGKIGYAKGSKITGNIASLGATTYNASTSDQTIAAGKYLSGAQTIRKITTANISAANIKNGVTIQVGDSGSATRIANVTGTFANDATIAAGDVLSGKIGYNGANKITGNIGSKAATTYNTSTSDQTISSGQYLSGTQTIKAVTTSNIDAGNIKYNVVVKVGDANSATRIKNVTGTFTSDGTIAATDVLSGKIGYSKGSKITGSIASLGATTYNASTSDQTIAAGKYLSGAQTIRKITTANISAGNIKKGVTIQVGDSGSATRIANVTGTCPQCSFPNSDWIPIFFRRDVGWNGWYYTSDSSSQWVSQRTVGWFANRDYDSGADKPFCVPSRVLITYFPELGSSSTTTMYLEANTIYHLKGTSSTGSPYLAIYNNSGTRLTYFYKMTAWSYA